MKVPAQCVLHPICTRGQMKSFPCTAGDPSFHLVHMHETPSVGKQGRSILIGKTTLYTGRCSNAPTAISH